MKRFTQIILAILVAVVAFVSGCDHRIDITPFESAVGGNIIGDTSYVEVTPPWGGFTSPRAVLVGNDQLIYVADYDANEVVMLDAGGTVLKRRSVLHPTALAQNSKLDLYVAGETIASNGDTIGAVYRIFLVRLDTSFISHIDTIHNPNGTITIVVSKEPISYFYDHDLAAAPMHIVFKEPGKRGRRYTGIGVLPSNGYLVARTGTDNTSFVDPDTRLLLFNKGDTLITPIADLNTRPSGGTAITDIRFLTGIFVFPSSYDVIITQSSLPTDGIAYGALWFVYTNTPDFQGYLPKFDPTREDQRGIDFIHSYRYQKAVSAAYDKRKREVFILDAQLDSVVKFGPKGNFRPESFGAYLTSQGQLPPMRHPMGIAFSNDCTLYIADTGNGIIRRFRLSSQGQCF